MKILQTSKSAHKDLINPKKSAPKSHLGAQEESKASLKTVHVISPTKKQRAIPEPERQLHPGLQQVESRLRNPHHINIEPASVTTQ